MTVELLSRIQFAMTISFHFVWPPMTIGLSLALVVLQTLRVATGRPVYTELARFWTRVFGLVFAMGVATGIPMEFQFGTNWARYARFVGDIFGSPLAIEGIYAFFMESGFLALLLFGWQRIGPKMHLFSTCMVALGAHFSAIWILVANSWMQTPAGYHLARRMKVTEDGATHPFDADLGSAPFRYEEFPLPADYLVQPADLGSVRAVVHDISAAILNPSTIDRLTHTVLGCWITGAFVLVAVGAWWLLRGRHVAYARISLRVGLSIAVVACFLQLAAADRTARGVARNQPTKLAAMEGLARTTDDAPLGIVGWTSWTRDESGSIVGVETRELAVPGLLSILVSGDFLHPTAARSTVVPGLLDLPSDDWLRKRHPDASDEELKAIRPNYWPNVPLVYQTYHLMIALGLTMTTIAIAAAAFWWRGLLWRTELRSTRWILVALVLTPFMAQVTMQAGWFTAEVGRQPWIVYEVLKTNEAASAIVKAPQVVRSIILFLLIYAFLTALFASVFVGKIRHGPESEREPVSPEAGPALAHRADPRIGD